MNYEQKTENEGIIECGVENSIVIDKLYGPTIFGELRVVVFMDNLRPPFNGPDKYRNACFIIQRKQYLELPEGSMEPHERWVEICRIPAQLEKDGVNEFDGGETPDFKNPIGMLSESEYKALVLEAMKNL